MKATEFVVHKTIHRKGYLFRGNEHGMTDHGRIWIGIYKDEYGQPYSTYFAWRIVVIDTGYELSYQCATKKEAIETARDNWHLVVRGYNKGI